MLVCPTNSLPLSSAIVRRLLFKGISTRVSVAVTSSAFFLWMSSTATAGDLRATATDGPHPSLHLLRHLLEINSLEGQCLEYCPLT